jgi:hypothetical protein
MGALLTGPVHSPLVPKGKAFIIKGVAPRKTVRWNDQIGHPVALVELLPHPPGRPSPAALSETSRRGEGRSTREYTPSSPQSLKRVTNLLSDVNLSQNSVSHYESPSDCPALNPISHNSTASTSRYRADVPSHATRSRWHQVTIENLNPQTDNWQIRARIKQKTSLQTSKRGSKYFNVTLTDGTGEIKAVCFDETMYTRFVQGRTYLIANAAITVANKDFNPTADYEMKINSSTDIEEVPLVQYG